MIERACQRCEKPLTGKQRKWCSENCCKRASEERHRGECQDCGTPLALGSSWRGYLRCTKCELEQRARRHEAVLARVEELWKSGASQYDIIEALGRKRRSGGAAPELDELMKAGRIKPRRVGFDPEPRAVRDDLIVRLYNEGAEWSAIAAEAGMSTNFNGASITHVLRRLRREGRIGYRRPRGLAA